MTHCDLLVAGLGVMGSAVAHQAALRGARVIGIDRFRVPHPYGSSHGETRNIRQAIYENPGYVPLLLRAYELWLGLQADTGRDLVRVIGRVTCGAPGGRIVSGLLRSAREHQLVVEILPPDEVIRRWPLLLPSDDMIGIFEPKAGVLFAEPCVEALLDQARRLGADLRFEERLLEWRPSGRGVVVRTSKAVYFADHLLLAAGGWMTQLVPALPLAVERQVLLWFEPRSNADDLSIDRHPSYLWELGPELTVYGVPYWGDGIKVARHHGGEIGTVDTVRQEVDERDVAQVRSPLERHMPAVPGRFIRGRVCMYTNTPDGHFVIDRDSRHAAVLLVSPCSGHGFKFAPAIGEAVAEIALDGRSRQDLSMFRADRWPA